MHRWIKYVFFMLLLIGAGNILGIVCRQIGQIERLIFAQRNELLILLLWFLLALIVMMVFAGMVSSLVRPLWVTAIAFALSGVALLFGWQVSLVSGILVLLFILTGVVYARNVMHGLDKQIEFSVRPIIQSQSLLLIAFLLVICGSIYLGLESYIKREGFSIPEPYLESITKVMEKQMVLRESEQGSMEVAVKFREEFQRFIDGIFDETVKPYERFLPLMISGGLFLSFYSIASLLTWIPGLILSMVFPLLTRLGVTKVVSETREVRRLIVE